MTHPFTPKSQSSDSDIAYHFLLAQGHTMYYSDLIQEVLKARNLPSEPGMVSAVLTQINLDTRFTYLGKGEWGLRAWVTSRGSRKLSTVSSSSKGFIGDDDEADLDEEKDLSVEADYEGESDEEERDLPELQEVSYKNRLKRANEDSWN